MPSTRYVVPDLVSFLRRLYARLSHDVSRSNDSLVLSGDKNVQIRSTAELASIYTQRILLSSPRGSADQRR